ncbi:cation-transporting P-type ATPase [Streptomyces globosus]|uniref:cation-transporting P-type ATPase n=1 Tax=Streptomyces globosus TaxID=68209 RepID=UPI0036362570
MTSRAVDAPATRVPAPQGLTQAEAERRLARHGRNEVSLPGRHPSTGACWRNCAIH